MNTAFKKSRYHKQSTKSGNEDNNPEEEELKKYREVIEKLGHTIQKNKSKEFAGGHYSDSAMESNNSSPSSNIRRTTSRTKEIFNDRDFLINFMNDETMPILPRNMHLLTDDDTNQNIDDKTKFQNLANLLLDDKETVNESFFVKKVEDKMILKLYTALSRKSKDIFMEENNDNKDKNRILLHKLNNIEIPRFKFEDKDTISSNNDNLNNNINLIEEKDKYADNRNLGDDNDENNTILKTILKKSKKDNSELKDQESENPNILILNLNENSNRSSFLKFQNEFNDKSSKGKPHFHPRCKYNKKYNKLKIIKLPTLDNFTQARTNKIHSRKSRRIPIPQPQKYEQFEPDIDADLLAYINHNIIKIEDIYNKGKENVFELKENLEDEVKPIEAKEVFFDINKEQNDNNEENSENNKTNKKSISNISEEDETDLKYKNKFCEYKDRTPNLIGISLLVEPDKKKISDFHKELQELYTNRINEIGELGEEMFPPFGKDLNYNKIYKYALNNERNEEISTDNFTLLGESTNLSVKSNKSKKSEKKEFKLNLNLGEDSKKSEEEEEKKSEESYDESINNNEDNQENQNIDNFEDKQNEEEKNESEKNNILYGNDTNNLYSLEDNNEYNEQSINNNNEDKYFNNKSDIGNNNNINYVSNNDFMNNDNNNDNNGIKKDDMQDHILQLSFSKNSSN